MFQFDMCQAMEALEGAHWRRRGAEQWAIRGALKLYQAARNEARMRRVWYALTGRSACLYDLDDLTPSQAVPGHGCAGTRSVALRKIIGSEGRSRDFDREFDPLQNHTRERWLGVAVARRTGVPLPPVKLVQVGDVYFVRDGHHRVSVARALGQEEIDAVVYVWQVTGPLPWERPERTRGMAHQPA